MALISSVLRQLFDCFAHFLRREGTPQTAQQCAAQESAAKEKLPEECEAFDFPANDRKCRRRRRKVVHSLENVMEGGSVREAGEKKRKKRKRKERKITEPMPLLVEVKPLSTTVRCSFLKPIEGEPPMPTSVSGHLALPAAGFKPLPPVTKPSVHPQKPALAPEDVLSLPCSPLQVDPAKLLAVPPCPDEVVSLRHSSSHMLPLAVPPRPIPAHDEVVALRRPPSRKPQPFTSSPFEQPAQLMLVDIEDEESEYVEYTGRTIWASTLLMSERPQTPEAEMKPRKMVAWLEKDSEEQEEAWASEGLEVQGPTPTHDEVVALRRPPSRKPQPFTSSLFESPSQLSMVDIEDEESEYVEYTGKIIRTIDSLKSERPQTLEAEIKPRKIAWLEKDSEVQEEAWADEVEEVQEFKEEEGDPSEMGDSKAIQGHSDDASQIDELTMNLVCESSTDGPKNETQHNVNVQKKSKRKVPFFLFTWAEEKVKKRKEKKIIKERERREKQLLLERYMNDPKLKHLWINKHNRNYNSS